MKLSAEEAKRARAMADAGHTKQHAAFVLDLPFGPFGQACQRAGIRWKKLPADERKTTLADDLTASAVRYSAGAMDRAKQSLKLAIAAAKFQIENETAPPYKGHPEDFF